MYSELYNELYNELYGLPSGRPLVQVPAGPTLRVLKRRKCCLCKDILQTVRLSSLLG